MMADGAGVSDPAKAYVNPDRRVLETPGVYIFSHKDAPQGFTRLTVKSDLAVILDGFGCHLEGHLDPNPAGAFFGGGTTVDFAKAYLASAASGSCPAPEGTGFYIQGIFDVQVGVRRRDFPFGNMLFVQVFVPYPYAKANFKPPFNPDGAAARGVFSKVEALPLE
ncbi:hypothetical protein [Phenylobacterium sp.]|uniref:hypothetical protein n=1 Tax=Phenylobacterium sp. TaxID=1871053 RepID=UPI002E2F0633|nr:hypothetical protein [Phenylobacterium sp.]HEX3365161.1 hypothetical protein [Phenylobacterium sp.]